MDKSSDLILSVNACTRDGSCTLLDLNLSQSQLELLEKAINSNIDSFDFSSHYEFFAISFGVTLSFYFISKVCGVILDLIKKI